MDRRGRDETIVAPAEPGTGAGQTSDGPTRGGPTRGGRVWQQLSGRRGELLSFGTALLVGGVAFIQLARPSAVAPPTGSAAGSSPETVRTSNVGRVGLSRTPPPHQTYLVVSETTDPQDVARVAGPLSLPGPGHAVTVVVVQTAEDEAALQALVRSTEQLSDGLTTATVDIEDLRRP